MRDILKIETERLTLRPLRLADAARLAAFACDPSIARMVSRLPHPFPAIAVEGWILIMRARTPLGEDYVFGVELKGEGLIGCIGAHKKPSGAFEIGYWIGRPYWGEGLATEAAQAFVEEARKLGPLEAGHFVDNPASGRVLERAGFTYTGDTEATYSLGRGARVETRRMRLRAGRAPKPARDSAVCAA